MVLPVTAVTVAFGCPDVVKNWVRKWSSAGASCLISDNGNQLPSDFDGKARILPFTGNNGFGAGINRAVKESGTPVVIITNPDTLPENSESLSRLLECHVVGNFTGASTYDSSGRAIHSSGVWPDREWVRSQIIHPTQTLWRSDRTDWLQGSLIMTHRNDFLDVGGFSSSFPLYFEDVDICARAVKQGMGINFCEAGRFIHDEGSGSVPVTATRLSCFHWGMLQYFKIHDPENAEAVRKMIMAKCFLRLIAYTLFNFEAARGYFRALQCVLSGVAPKLPGELND